MKIGKTLLNLLYPRRATCVGCGDLLGCDRDDLCEECREELAKNWVGPRMPAPETGLDGAAYAYRYHGPAGAMVRSLKYTGVRVLVPTMCDALADAVKLLRLENLYAVTSVPMPKSRLRRRGLDHAALLAQGVADAIGAPYAGLLTRTRNAPQQARLSHEERIRNLRGAFAATENLKGKQVLLIDDVFTTGSTAKYCAEALRAAGAERVWYAAFALGEKGKKNG